MFTVHRMLLQCKAGILAKGGYLSGRPVQLSGKLNGNVEQKKENKSDLPFLRSNNAKLKLPPNLVLFRA